MLRLFFSSIWVIVAISFISVTTPTWVSGQTADAIRRGQLSFNEGVSLASKGDAAMAIAKFTEAIAFTPDWHLPYLNRGVMRMSVGQLVEAEEDADKALSLIRPDLPSAKVHSALAYQVKGSARQQRGENSIALDFFTKAVELDPKNPKILNSLGTALRVLGKLEEALNAHNKSIEMNSTVSMFYVNRSYVLEKLGKSDDAFKDLNKAISLNQNDATAYYTRGAMRMRVSLYSEALTDLDKAIQLNSNTSGYFHARGLCHYNLKNYEDAVKDQTRAVELDPKNVRAFSDRAIIHAAMKNLKLAVEDLRTAIAIAKNSSVLRYNLAYFLYQSGEYEASIQILTEVITNHPNWKAPYMLRSNGYIKQGMQAKARADRAKLAAIASDVKPTGEQYTIFNIDVAALDEAVN
ncbi:MAG TPA: hypothetical protein DEP46_16110 [Blastocatellia bacterium]|nr:hypothetical protein [Blastocatellia bacterium]